MDLKKLQEKTRKIIVAYGDEAVTVEYYFGRLSRQFYQNISERLKDSDKDQAATIVADLVKSWDVTVDDQPLLPTYDNLLRIPGLLLNAIYEEIQDDAVKLAASGSKA